MRAEPGALAAYSWGDRELRFVRCANCGCITHWEAVEPKADSRIGVNARNLDPREIAHLPVRHYDGASM